MGTWGRVRKFKDNHLLTGSCYILGSFENWNWDWNIMGWLKHGDIITIVSVFWWFKAMI